MSLGQNSALSPKKGHLIFSWDPGVNIMQVAIYVQPLSQYSLLVYEKA